MSQTVEAKTRPLAVTHSVDRGHHVVINAGNKWKSKSVIVEVGVQSKKKTWKWSRVGTARTDRRGATQVCSGRTISRGNQLRVRSGKQVIATMKVSKPITLSGCGYVAPTITSSTVTPLVSTPTSEAPAATTPAQSVNTTTPPTTIPPTTTSTTLAPFTAAPTSLALAAASDTGDSSSDGITNATSLIVQGSATPQASVQLYLNGTTSGSACTADGSGDFACTLGTVAEGNHAITARATLDSVESTHSSTYNIVVDRTAPTASMTAESEFINSNESTTVNIALSENSTTLGLSDINVWCTMENGCATSGFTGSGRNFSFTFTMVNNTANGGTLSLPIGSFFDVAGNGNGAVPLLAIMYDSNGPTATLTRSGTTITISFNEVPYGFSVTSLRIQVYGNSVFHSAYPWGMNIDNFTPVGATGRVWSFELDQTFIDDRDISAGGTQYNLALDVISDVDGNTSSFSEHLIP
jgi:hypothetical protein